MGSNVLHNNFEDLVPEKVFDSYETAYDGVLRLFEYDEIDIKELVLALTSLRQACVQIAKLIFQYKLGRIAINKTFVEQKRTLSQIQTEVSSEVLNTANLRSFLKELSCTVLSLNLRIRLAGDRRPVAEIFDAEAA